MMYVPLNSVIVTHVYESCKSSGTVVPKTMTQLYSSLIRALLLCYLKDKEEYKDTCTNINSFKDLPQPVYDQFCEICKIAYTGIMSAETELIFQDLPSDFDPLGLMQTCPELYVDGGASVSYNFLHLTVQEYLAAYHISQQSTDVQVAFLRNHIERRNLEVTVRFLAGLTELGSDLWDVVGQFASRGSAHSSLVEVGTKFIKLEILHWLFESRDSSAITSVLGSNSVFFSPDFRTALQPFDLYVLGYCITLSSCNWGVELHNCELESVQMFLRALNLQENQCQSPSTGKIKTVWLREFNPAAAHFLVDKMSQMPVFSNVKHLHLVRSGVTSETCNLLSKHTDLLQHLECLNLNDNHNIGRRGALNVITSLTKFSTIREIHLVRTGIGFEDCKALSELLATSKATKTPEEKTTTQLQILDLRSNPVGLGGAVAFASKLKKNQCLKKLYLSDDSVGVEGALELIESLKHNTTLEKLMLSPECRPSSFHTLDLILHRRVTFGY